MLKRISRLLLQLLPLTPRVEKEKDREAFLFIFIPI